MDQNKNIISINVKNERDKDVIRQSLVEKNRATEKNEFGLTSLTFFSSQKPDIGKKYFKLKNKGLN